MAKQGQVSKQEPKIDPEPAPVYTQENIEPEGIATNGVELPQQDSRIGDVRKY